MSATQAPAATARPRRSVGLFMLTFALALVVFAFIQVGLARDGAFPVGMLGYGIAIGVLTAAAYIAMARFAPHADPLILPLAALLNGLGVAMIYRLDTSTSRAAESVGGVPALGSTANQLIWTALAVGLFTIVLLLLRDVRILQRYMYTIGAAGLFLLALPGFLPASISSIDSAQDAKIWIRLGPLSVQPGEFAKLMLVAFFAGYLVNKRDALALAGKRLLFIDLPRARDLGPILAAWGVSLGVLVFERDLGSALLFFGLFITMLYIATQRFSWMLIGLLLFSTGASIAYFLFAHVQLRVDIWLHPWAGDRWQDESFQLVQSLYGLATGGILGEGLGQGRPNLVPLAHSDFIFAALGEELGLTGAMVILLVYVLLVQRGLSAALGSRDQFSKLLAGGLSFALALQVFVVIGGVTRLIPLTGLVTPFMSQGGSALLANWILIAVLIRVSDQARRPAPQPIQEEGMTQVVSRQ